MIPKATAITLRTLRSTWFTKTMSTRVRNLVVKQELEETLQGEFVR